MNFNFNDNLFGGIDEDLEKEIMGLKRAKKPDHKNNKSGSVGAN